MHNFPNFWFFKSKFVEKFANCHCGYLSLFGKTEKNKKQKQNQNKTNWSNFPFVTIFLHKCKK